jgi:hypothetical protein
VAERRAAGAAVKRLRRRIVQPHRVGPADAQVKFLERIEALVRRVIVSGKLDHVCPLARRGNVAIGLTNKRQSTIFPTAVD